MRFTVNTNGEVINGTFGNDDFAVLYSEGLFKALLELQEKSENAATVADFNAICEEGKALVEKAEVEIEATKNPFLFFNKKTNTYHLKYNDIISDMPIPQVLVDRILLSMDKTIDFMPVIKMVARVMRNPKVLDGDVEFLNRFANYIDIKVVNPDLRNKLMDEKGFSMEVATEAARMYSIQITKEGMLKCYKVSSEIDWKWELDEDGNKVKKELYPKTKAIDPISGLITYSEPEMPMAEDRLFEPAVMHQGGDAFYCLPQDFDGDFSKFKPAHIIKVGHIISHDSWDKVDCDDYRSCVKGLHCGGLDYIRGYQDSNTQTHNVIVDPMDIGAICDDSTGAMRVLRYFVLDVFKGVNNSVYHSSTYSKFTDSEFQKFIKKSIEDLNEQKKNWLEAEDKFKKQVNSLV